MNAEGAMDAGESKESPEQGATSGENPDKVPTKKKWYKSTHVKGHATRNTQHNTNAVQKRVTSLMKCIII
jgi:hypothetical protein